MIVDDQNFATNMLRQMVKVLGAMEVSVFSNGEEAWTFYKTSPADLVILDWQMSPMSGLKLTQLIRKSPESPNTFVPIIMVTSYREREHVFRARDAGVTEYVIKPVAPKSLFSRIEAVIEKPRRFVRVGEFFGPDRRRHSKEFAGDDRRGKDEATKDTKGVDKDKHQDMGQDEINRTYNPNEDNSPSAK